MKANQPRKIGNLTSSALLIISGFIFFGVLAQFSAFHPFYRFAIIFIGLTGVLSFLSLLFLKYQKLLMIPACISLLFGVVSWVHDFMIQAKFFDLKPLSLEVPVVQDKSIR